MELKIFLVDKNLANFYKKCDHSDKCISWENVLGVAKVHIEILFFFPNNFFIMDGVKFDGPGNCSHLKKCF
jgi:hypothetical protein